MTTQNTDLTGKQFLLLCIVAALILFGLFAYDLRTAPALTEFGQRHFALTCSGSGRTYRIRSGNQTYGSTTKSIYNRYLAVLDEVGNQGYYTKAFDPESLDRFGFLAFKPRRDGPSLKEIADSTVLSGDEREFHIAGTLDSIVIVDRSGKSTTYKCALE